LGCRVPGLQSSGSGIQGLRREVSTCRVGFKLKLRGSWLEALGFAPPCPTAARRSAHRDGRHSFEDFSHGVLGQELLNQAQLFLLVPRRLWDGEVAVVHEHPRRSIPASSEACVTTGATSLSQALWENRRSRWLCARATGFYDTSIHCRRVFTPKQLIPSSTPGPHQGRGVRYAITGGVGRALSRRRSSAAVSLDCCPSSSSSESSKYSPPKTTILEVGASGPT